MNSKSLTRYRLKELRTEKCLTRPQVFEATGISIDTLKSWELGITTPTIENIRILADYYGVSLDYIAGRTNEPKVNNPIDPDNSNSN